MKTLVITLNGIVDLQQQLGQARDSGLAHEGERPPSDAQAGGDLGARRSSMAQLTRLRTERGVAERLGLGAAGHHLHPEVQVIAFGEQCAVLGLPGEFFAETGIALQEASSMPHLLVACYANHYAGYFVPADAFDAGGYEPGVTMLDGTAEAITRAAAIELLRGAG